MKSPLITIGVIALLPFLIIFTLLYFAMHRMILAFAERKKNITVSDDTAFKTENLSLQ